MRSMESGVGSGVSIAVMINNPTKICFLLSRSVWISTRARQSIEIAFRETRPEIHQILENLPSVTDVQKRGDKLSLITEDPAQTLRQILGVIEEQGFEPITLNTLGASLEDAFLWLTGAEMEAEVIHRRRNKR